MRNGIFKLMSVIAFTCFLFSIFEFFSSSIQWIGNIGYVALIGALAVACLSFLFANIFNSGSKGLAMITVIILTVASSAMLLFLVKSSVQVVVVSFIFDIFVGYSGYRAFASELDKTLSKKKMITMALITLGVMVYAYYKAGNMLNELSWAFFIGLIACMFILNRTLLENLYKKKSSESTDVSRLVQRFNMYIVGGLTAIFAILFLLKTYVSYMLNLGLYLVGLGFINAFNKANSESTLNNGNVNQATTQINLPPEFTQTKAQWADQSWVIAMIVAGVIFSILIIYGLIKLIKIAPQGFQLFMQKLKDFFSRMMGLNQVGVKMNSGDFVDEVENIEKSELGDDRYLKMLQNQKKVRAIKDPVERMRAFYAYFMNTLKRNNVPLYASDTTYQINDKSRLVCDMEEITKKVTDMYNQVRYNDNVPDDKTLDVVDQYMSDITKNCKALKLDEDKKGKKKGK